MKSELLVIADQHAAVNTFPGLVHTARDERLTTVEAHRVLRETGVRGAEKKQYVDELAAVFILQCYLDSLRNSNSAAE